MIHILTSTIPMYRSAIVVAGHFRRDARANATRKIGNTYRRESVELRAMHRVPVRGFLLDENRCEAR
jgi:hypothetical protein